MLVRIIRHVEMYFPNEVASFPEKKALALIKARAAVSAEPVKVELAIAPPDETADSFGSFEISEVPSETPDSFLSAARLKRRK